jgi:dienelactone hydrolase
MLEQFVEYEHGGVTFEGYLAVDGGNARPRSAVMIAHTWQGRGEFVCDKARVLAGQGYAGFAIDLYGNGVVGNSAEESANLMQPLLDDRALLHGRLLAALAALQKVDGIDSNRIAAIGYCFGGLCVLDLARIDAPVRGVVSLHGLLTPPPTRCAETIRPRVLVLHGNDDPMAPIEDVVALERELTAAGADWQLHTYGNTMHSFTNPNANDRALGTVYDANADRRSWTSLVNFLGEVLK